MPSREKEPERCLEARQILSIVPQHKAGVIQVDAPMMQPGSQTPSSILLPCAQEHSPLQNFTPFQVLERYGYVQGPTSVGRLSIDFERFSVSAIVAVTVLAGSDKCRQDIVHMIAEITIVHCIAEGRF